MSLPNPPELSAAEPVVRESASSELRRALWAERAAVSAWLAGAALFGVGLNLWTAPQYRATARLEIRRPIEAPAVGVVSFQSENIGLYTTAALITNRRLLQQVAGDVAVHDWLDPEVWSGRPRARARALVAGAGWVQPAGYRRPTAADLDARLDWLASIVRVEPVQDTRLVDIRVEHPLPVAAREIADRLCERFVAYAAARSNDSSEPGSRPSPPATNAGIADAPMELSPSRSQRVPRISTGDPQLYPATLKPTLLESPAAPTAMSEPIAPDAQDGLSLRSRTRQLEDRISQLSDQLVRSEADAAVAQARAAQLARWTPDSVLEVGALPVEGPGLAGLRQELVARQMQLASARQVYGDRHPRMRALVAELQVLKAAIEQELRRAVAEVRADQEALATRAASLRQDLRASEEELARYERLEPVAVTTAPSHARPPVEIIDRATVDPEPVRPRKALNLIACISAGGLLGSGLATYRRATRRTLRDPEDVERELRLPVLGMCSHGS